MMAYHTLSTQGFFGGDRKGTKVGMAQRSMAQLMVPDQNPVKMWLFIRDITAHMDQIVTNLYTLFAKRSRP